MTKQKYLEDFITRALEEDIGDGDHSSNCSIPPSQEGSVSLIAKENGIIAGLDYAFAVFSHIDSSIRIEKFIKDGDHVKVGDVVCQIDGKVTKLLTGERLFLNLLQRMSGIATKTRHFVDLIAGTGAQVLDTRKTTPNLRFFEKYAVRVGGGKNHRMGLYDMIMLKDNHVDFAGGIAQAIAKANKYLEEHQLKIPIEIETRSFEEIEQVIAAGNVDRVMFDNFSVADTYKAVKLVNGMFETESSGGINESTIKSYAETGVNFVSVGALTHSVKSLDLSLKAI